MGVYELWILPHLLDLATRNRALHHSPADDPADEIYGPVVKREVKARPNADFKNQTSGPLDPSGLIRLLENTGNFAL
jgi:hypothetical protein